MVSRSLVISLGAGCQIEKLKIEELGKGRGNWYLDRWAARPSEFHVLSQLPRHRPPLHGMRVITRSSLESIACTTTPSVSLETYAMPLEHRACPSVLHLSLIDACPRSQEVPSLLIDFLIDHPVRGGGDAHVACGLVDT